jgi:hypothetical protein
MKFIITLLIFMSFSCFAQTSPTDTEIESFEKNLSKVFNNGIDNDYTRVIIDVFSNGSAEYEESYTNAVRELSKYVEENEELNQDDLGELKGNIFVEFFKIWNISLYEVAVEKKKLPEESTEFNETDIDNSENQKPKTEDILMNKITSIISNANAAIEKDKVDAETRKDLEDSLLILEELENKSFKVIRPKLRKRINELKDKIQELQEKLEE